MSVTQGWAGVLTMDRAGSWNIKVSSGIGFWELGQASYSAQVHIHHTLEFQINMRRKVLSLTKPKGIKRNPSAIILQKLELLILNRITYNYLTTRTDKNTSNL